MFYIGQEVICINNTPFNEGHSIDLEKDKLYTVQDVKECPKCREKQISVGLHNVAPKHAYCKCGYIAVETVRYFLASRFIPYTIDGLSDYVVKDSNIIQKPKVAPIVRVGDGLKRIIKADSHKPNIEHTALILAATHYSDIPEDKPALDIEEVLTICAKVWGVEKESIKGKIKHNDRKHSFIQNSFIWAAKYFCNLKKYDFAKEYISCQWKTIRYAVDRMNDTILEGERRSESTKLLDILSLLIEKCPGRIDDKEFRPVLKYRYGADFAEAEKKFWDLDSYQLNKIPVRERTWFEGVPFSKTDSGKDLQFVIIYSLDGKVHHWINLQSYGNNRYLYLLQNYGFRFISAKDGTEREKFRMMHPVCDKCINRNGCKSLEYWAILGSKVDRSKCYQGVEDNPLKVDIQLLNPLEQFQLQ